ncbi:MAG: restriction endonuclease subunit S, partial [Eubacterium sp.]|nr:restriction endonuclease subunit S [Eubacterium sp.]
KSERKITELGLQKSSAKMLPANRTILFTSRAGIGKTAILQHSACTNQGFQSLVLKNEIEPYFVYSMSNQLKEKAEAVASGSTFLEISGKMLANLNLMMPNRDEQERIAAHFKSLDKLIIFYQRKYEKLKLFKEAMLEKMFPKNGEKVPEIRFKGFTDDWQQCKLDVIADVRDGTHDSPQYTVDGHPFVTSKNVKDGYINYNDIQFISEKDYKEVNKRSKVDKNDILMGMIGTIGNIALVREIPDFAIKNVALIKDTGNIFYLYLYHCLQSASIVNQLNGNLDGGTQKFIALNKVRELDIPIPNVDEQHKIGDCMEYFDNLIILHQHKYEKLKLFKEAMLNKMFI